MVTLARIVHALRLPFLLLTVPYALMWSGVEASGGIWLVAAHTLLVLLYLLSLDRGLLALGMDRRLALVRGGSRELEELIGGARGVVVGLLVVVVTLLLFERLWVALVSAGSAVLIGLLAGRVTRGSLRHRMRFASLTWAMAAMVAPALLVRGFAERARRALEADPDRMVPMGFASMTESLLAASFVGALVLGGYVALCVVRDEPVDRGDGVRTLATRGGRSVGVGFALAWLLSAVLLAVSGASWGLWGAVPAVACAWGAVLSVSAMSARWDDTAVTLWWLTGAVVSVSLAVSLA